MKEKAGRFGAATLCAAALAFLVFIAPKEPTQAAAVRADARATLHITEVMTANASAVADGRGEYPDWIELTHEGEAAVNIGGCGLSDRATHIAFVFPDLVLAPGERVVVFASGKEGVQGELHANFKLSSAGEAVVLFGPDGAVIEAVETPALASDTVYARTLDGWQTTSLYSPGYENSLAGHEAYLAGRRRSLGNVVINEIAASVSDGHDWIELYNVSDAPQDLSGFGLSDDGASPGKWRIPQGTVLAPQEHLLVYASGLATPQDGDLHAGFKLSSQGETILLTDAAGRMQDYVTFGPLERDTSYGRAPDGASDFCTLFPSTPGTSYADTGALDAARLSNNSAGLYITEVLTANQSTALPGVAGRYDYVEIANLSGAPVSLAGYYLSDNPKKPRKWPMPDVLIADGECTLIYCEKENVGLATDTVHYANFNLSVAGESVLLCDADGREVDRIDVPPLYDDISYGRTRGEVGLFYYDRPTPGEWNTGGYAGFAPAPSIETAGGLHERPLEVTIRVPPGCTVTYTLDGSEPTEQSEPYEGPVEIAQTTVLRARAFQDGFLPSEIATQTYFVSVYHTLPIVALTIDPENLWNDETGMLADGEGWSRDEIDPEWFSKDFVTYGKKLRYNGYVEMYDEAGNPCLSQGMSFRLMGQYSLDMPQKSFLVNAQAQFGSELFHYPLFSDRPYAAYDAFVLRNGGQDGKYTRVLDGLQARLAEETGTSVVTQAWRPVIVYLNGQYWGHYNLRERMDAQTMARHEGWEDPEELDVLESDGLRSSQVNQGTNADYVQLVEYAQTHDLSRDEEARCYVLDRVDLDNMLDYFFLEMFFGNTDPGNIRFYKSDAHDGRWRYALYDLDWGLFKSTYGGPAYVLSEKGMGGMGIQSNALLRALIAAPEIQDRFLKRGGQMFQTVLTTEHMTELLEEMVEEIRPEMDMHFERWAGQMHPKISADQPRNGPGAKQYWLERVARAKDTLRRRPSIFWEMVRAHFDLSEVQMESYFGPQPPADETAE